MEVIWSFWPCVACWLSWKELYIGFKPSAVQRWTQADSLAQSDLQKCSLVTASLELIFGYSYESVLGSTPIFRAAGLHKSHGDNAHSDCYIKKVQWPNDQQYWCRYTFVKNDCSKLAQVGSAPQEEAKWYKKIWRCKNIMIQDVQEGAMHKRPFPSHFKGAPKKLRSGGFECHWKPVTCDLVYNHKTLHHCLVLMDVCGFHGCLHQTGYIYQNDAKGTFFGLLLLKHIWDKGQ